MVREALTGYWSLVSGLTEVTVERARAAARSVLAQSEATREQVSGLAQEITEASRVNREALLKLIRYEAERAAGRLGFASTDEVTTLQGRVRELERSIAELRVAADAAGPVSGSVADRPAALTPAAGPAEPGAAEPAAPVSTRGAGAAGRTAPAPAGRKAAKNPGKAPAKKAAKAAKATPATKAPATKAAKAAKAAPPDQGGSGA
jgi:polyhydroxyalkanoate synthesis regulator phasin